MVVIDANFIFTSPVPSNREKRSIPSTDILSPSIECHGCKLIPPNRVTSLKLGALYVRCVKCNFNRHCPLSKTIQLDDIHHHRLTLKDNFDDIFDDFDDGEYCCDVCEIRRDSEECVYHCEECHFVAS
ncbi:hypothetical protein CUMW_225870 [Citrus unshiu]|uniref:DC1 domain-containing protein n=1 Tax=Citrus unshiu TaxID=55188 RepID=A0A2H5QFQ8_CITUN|nr:hypothetical protein CUMW_225870 [Citrus unshiu]